MGNRLYVGNLPYNATDEQIREFFEGGTTRRVSQVKIITDRETGKPRGFAFVEFQSAQMADTAIAELHGTQFGGRTIVVNQAHQPRGGDDRGGGGGSGGGDRGGDRSDRGERADRGDRGDRGMGGAGSRDRRRP